MRFRGFRARRDYHRYEKPAIGVIFVVAAVCIIFILFKSGWITGSAVSEPEFDSSEFPKQVFEEINRVRGLQDVAELDWNNRLAEVAEKHSLDMMDRNYFNGTSPDGKVLNDRLSDVWMSCAFAGENLYSGEKTPAEPLVANWTEQGEMLSPNLETAGVGIAVNESSEEIWVVGVFCG